MRLVALLFGLTGCQAVFPLRDKAGDDDVPADSTVDGLAVQTMVVGQAIVGESIAVNTVVSGGTPNTAITYDVLLDDDPLQLFPGEIALDAGGAGTVTNKWNPGKLGHVAITSRADDDPAFTSPATSGTNADVFQRFGDLTGDVTAQPLLPVLTVVAVPLPPLPNLSRVERLSIHVSTNAGSATGILGLYSGSANRPINLVASTPTFDITGTTVIELPPMEDKRVAVLNYWVAFVANQDTQLPTGPLNPISAIRTFTTTVFALPDPFPATPDLFATPVAASVTVGPVVQ